MSQKVLKVGQLIARGVCRHLKQHNFACLVEFTPIRGSRVDVIAVGPKGEIWIIECKSSLADYNQDNKWEKYLAFCDRYFWAIPQEFPSEIISSQHGLIIADTYDAEIIRLGTEYRLSPVKRKTLITKIARDATNRLRSFTDPNVTKKYSHDLI